MLLAVFSLQEFYRYLALYLIHLLDHEKWNMYVITSGSGRSRALLGGGR